jgi:hypothetical protein
MSSQVWVPGAPAALPPPSVEDFLKRVHAQIQAFAQQCDCERAIVEVVLHDGRRLRLHSFSPEPGFGWVTLRPFPDDDGDLPEGDEELAVEETLMTPLQSIVRISMKKPPEEESHRFGFVSPEDDDEAVEEEKVGDA